MDNRALFLRHVAQTSPSPMGLEMVRASGIYQYDINNKAYIDFISGFSVANIGHSHPKVIAAVQEQAAAYMHLIVYGEFIQSPQVAYAQLLTSILPQSLNCVYFTNSGAEATEGAMKLAKRCTGRTKIIAFNNSYHGSTQGALSAMGSEYFRNAYRPLLPEVYHYDYGSAEAVKAIDENVACVLVEPVQAESGVTKPPADWLKLLREACDKWGSLLIFDEIQAGFGRTGSLWAFEQTGAVPDILLLGKALGGGMPLGAFVADYKLMQTLTHNPVLGHITTFGGHPVSCAAGKAALEVLLESDCIREVKKKEQLLLQYLQHPAILAVQSAGLWASLRFKDFETNLAIIHRCIANGLITDWFLFSPERMRIAPPLIITEQQLAQACEIILQSIKEAADG
jgi:acetylornithine/N-succinyldiaminopimelate aminotransferase